MQCTSQTEKTTRACYLGYEGVIGVALFIIGETMPNRAVVQSAGHAYRSKGQLLKEEFNRSGGLQQMLRRVRKEFERLLPEVRVP